MFAISVQVPPVFIFPFHRSPRRRRKREEINTVKYYLFKPNPSELPSSNQLALQSFVRDHNLPRSLDCCVFWSCWVLHITPISQSSLRSSLGLLDFTNTLTAEDMEAWCHDWIIKNIMTNWACDYIRGFISSNWPDCLRCGGIFHVVNPRQFFLPDSFSLPPVRVSVRVLNIKSRLLFK